MDGVAQSKQTSHSFRSGSCLHSYRLCTGLRSLHWLPLAVQNSACIQYLVRLSIPHEYMCWLKLLTCMTHGSCHWRSITPTTSHWRSTHQAWDCSHYQVWTYLFVDFHIHVRGFRIHDWELQSQSESLIQVDFQVLQAGCQPGLLVGVSDINSWFDSRMGTAGTHGKRFSVRFCLHTEGLPCQNSNPCWDKDFERLNSHWTGMKTSWSVISRNI